MPTVAATPTSRAEVVTLQGAADTYISQWFPSQQFGTEPDLWVYEGDSMASLLRFEMPQIDGGMNVGSASLQLYVLDRNSTTDLLIKPYGVLRSWDAGAANWTHAAEGVPWDAQGCNGLGTDRSGTSSGQVTVEAVGEWVTLDVTNIVRHWQEHPAENGGVILKGDATGGMAGYSFASSDYPLPAARPRLVVELTEATSHSHALALRPGLNMVSVPVLPDDASLEAVFAPIADDLVRIWAFDESWTGDAWRLYQPGHQGSTLQALGVERGYWVEMKNGTTLTIQGAIQLRTTVSLNAGWNFVGYPSTAERDIGLALEEIADALELVWYYDATDAADPWKRYNPTAPAWSNDLLTMSPGRGYWIATSEACQWTVASGE
jgi:hypothetical protein